MLHFFRRYQKFLFLFVTIIVVITFVFFGTYQAMFPTSTMNSNDEPAFVNPEGKIIKKSKVEEMSRFLKSDSLDALIQTRRSSSGFGGNILNEGVIQKDFIESGIATLIYRSFKEQFSEDLFSRAKKEKIFTPYVHPHSKQLSAESTWSLFAPEIPHYLSELKAVEDPTTDAAFEGRSKLYLAERQFPEIMLRQILSYQEQNLGSVEKDPKLRHQSLALFNYHTVEDWFGSSFVDSISEFILHTASIARLKGYRVTKEEALADLLFQAERFYQKIKDQAGDQLPNSHALFQTQVRGLGLDESSVISLWQDVMLFKRLFEDVGNSVLMDDLFAQRYGNFAGDKATIKVYLLPKELKLSDSTTLHQFEIYLEKVSSQDRDILELPTSFNSIEEIEKKTPELVQKRYRLEIQEISRADVERSIPLKDLWTWQIKEKNWQQLKKNFTELSLLETKEQVIDDEERFILLEQLESPLRLILDQKSRSLMLNESSDLIEKALNQKNSQVQTLTFQVKAKEGPLKGISDSTALMSLLDDAPLQDQENFSEHEKLALEKLHFYSQDNNYFYRISVKEKSGQKEVLTFSEALKKGILETLLKEKISLYYDLHKAEFGDKYKTSIGSWKSFDDVQDEIIALYFNKLYNVIHEDSEKNGIIRKDSSKDRALFAASYRFFNPLRKRQERILANEKVLPELLNNSDGTIVIKETLPVNELAKQWDLIEREETIARGAKGRIPFDEVSQMTTDQWSSVHATSQEIFFYKPVRRFTDQKCIESKLIEAKLQIATEAKGELAHQILEKMTQPKTQ